MCNCLDSPWAKRAERYLESHKNNPDEKWHTIDFLLKNNHCGIDNRVGIDEILEGLSSSGMSISREQFQQTVLGELKRGGIVATLVYPGPKGGVFIPCNEDDVKQVADQIFSRIESEIENLVGISQDTSFTHLVSELSKIVSSKVKKIEDR